MIISIDKTEVIHVKEQGRVTPTTAEEAKKVCKHVCPNLGCNKTFFNVHGCKVHAGKCRYREYYIADRILDVSNHPTGSPKRRFLVRWKGYEQQTWEPRRNLPKGMVKDFLIANQLYDFDWPGERCPDCDLPCKSIRGVNIHRRSCLLRPEDDQNFEGTCAAKCVRKRKLQKA